MTSKYSGEKCSNCGKALLKSNETRVCSEDCFYGNIYYGSDDDPGIFHPSQQGRWDKHGQQVPGWQLKKPPYPMSEPDPNWEFEGIL